MLINQSNMNKICQMTQKQLILKNQHINNNLQFIIYENMTESKKIEYQNHLDQSFENSQNQEYSNNLMFQRQENQDNLDGLEQSETQNQINEETTTNQSFLCQEDNLIHQKINPNILKNIIKSFFNFLMQQKNQDIIIELIPNKPYKQIMKNIIKYKKQFKYNNQYLVRLLQSKKYSKIFEYYITFDILDWINSSKLKQLAMHLQCIDFLKQCCVDKKQLQAIGFYTKKS
ncbi:hypothetical protein TTHERM_00502450 (macronuclear) [Tetrahymena thermophila SB210]|uniref:Uncharacterized protein n=1 Tax=Tetrahymena thermophila (strain SB210) TaxID=312017 RepID=I7LWK4_TETTS|nr:hypothetical protein TTHERM_00502450 [Tetrahymena thermophila SB210]EAS02054.2 hypothetical protein TTHERM_00502450 [Tetrahymena thermophila SB210]|eukprot:XP_001022299.2 hypothetical protein TTHERM_00502450 [Tetrahymena thermophila SB210]